MKSIRHTKSRVLALLLCLCLVMALLPTVAFAADPAYEKTGIVKSGGFRAAVTEEAEKDMINSVYISLNVSNKEAYQNYDYTYQCQGSDSSGNIQETKATDVKTYGEQYPYAYFKLTEGNLKAGTYTINVYEKDKFNTDAAEVKGTLKFSLVKYTFDAKEGKIEDKKSFNGGTVSDEGKKYVVYGRPGEFYFYTYYNLTVEAPETEGDKKFIGWSTEQNETVDDPHKDLIGNFMPKASSNGECTLYARYGTPKVTKLKIEAGEEYTDKSDLDYIVDINEKKLEMGFSEGTVAKVKCTNAGNQPFSIPNFTQFGPFDVKVEGTQESSGNDQPYKNGTFITLPKKDSTITYVFSLREGTGIGSYSHSASIRVGSQVYQISVSAEVKKAGVNVTLKSDLSKSYGKTMTSEELSKDASVEWVNGDGKGNAPKFEELGITLDSSGLPGTANANDLGYEINVVGAGEYDVTLQGNPKLKVTKATPTPSTTSPQVSVMKGHTLSDVKIPVTYTNPNNSQPVQGELKWDSEDTSWDQTGSQTATFTFTPTDQANYNNVTSSTADVTVTDKYVAQLTPNSSQTEVTYDGQEHTVDFTLSKTHEGDQGDLGAVTYKYEKKNSNDENYSSFEGNPKEAGTYRVTATMAETEYFAKATATATLVIKPKDISVSGATVQTKPYDGTTTATASNLTLDGVISADEGKVTATSSSAAFESADASEQPKVVTISGITLSGDSAGNYTLQSTDYRTVSKINPKTITVALKESKQAEKFYGQTLELTAESFTFTEPVEASPVTAEFISAGEPATANAGDHSVTITLTNGNYTFAEGSSQTIEDAVKVKQVPLASLNQFATTGYGHKGNNLETVKSLSGSFTNPYNGETVTGALVWKDGSQSMGDRESYEATWQFTPDDKTNYAEGPLEGTVVITLMDKYVVKLDIDNASLTTTYNGQPHPVDVKVLPCEGHEELIGIDANRAAQLKSSIKIQYKLKDGQEWQNEAPTDAGEYNVQAIIEAPFDLADSHVGNMISATLNISKATPDISGVTVDPVLEGTALNDVTPSAPTGVDGQELKGTFTFTSSDTTVTEDGLSYHWTFIPSDENYTDVSGNSVINLKDDPRKVEKAEIYNLPVGDGYTDYAVISVLSEEVKAGDKVVFYKDAALQAPINDAVAITDPTSERLEVLLQTGALESGGGTIYAKIEGKKTSAVSFSYKKEIDFNIPNPITIYIDDEYTGKANPSDGSYEIKSQTWTLAQNDVAVAVEGKDNTFKGLKAGETSMTVSVTFAHPDPVKAEKGETITVTRTVAVKVTSRPTGGGGGWTPSPSATVETGSAANGNFTVSDKNAKAGDTVKITPKANEGYEVYTVKVTDKNGKDVPVTYNSDGTWSFVMPEKAAQPVKVDVTFIDTPPAIVFVDVPAKAYYADAVSWAVEKGITNGTSTTTFSPDASCTRAQIVTFLWRAAGSPEPSVSENPFTDVDVNSYYGKAVLWAIEKGITKGTGAMTFSPDATCTRAQAVTFLYRYEDSPAASGSSFGDVKSDAYYAGAVAWAVGEEITNGTGANTFSPESTCTRSQIVTLLYRDMAE